MHDFVNLLFSLFRQAVPLALAGLVLGAILLALVSRHRLKTGGTLSPGQGIALLLLLCYLGGLAAITFLNRSDGLGGSLQLYPLLAFREAWNAFTLQVWLNPLLNIAMFVPLGILLPLAAKPFRRWYRMLAAGVGLSLAIEVLQFFLGRGQSDVDDLLCNTLGAMLGYCLCMLAAGLAQKRWKAALACAALPLLSAAALGGVLLAYQLQPYGNLAYAPIYPARTQGVTWTADCPLSHQPGPAGVYWAQPFTRESGDAFAVEFLARQGAQIDFGSPDVSYYDNTAIYSDHQTYSLVVNYNDRSYEYTDFRVDSALRYSETGGQITREALCAALEALGIQVPQAARFAAVDEQRGIYAFQADAVVEDGVLLDGTLTCRVAQGGLLYQVESTLSASTLQGDDPVLSPQAAYEALCAGRFSWRDVPSFNALAPDAVHVLDCRLGYLTDSKGFRQPVYFFTLSGLQENGESWTTFVPALA